MSAWSALGAGTRAFIVGIGAVGMVGVGYVGWQIGRPPPVPDETNVATAPAVASSAPAPKAAAPEAVAPVEEPVAAAEAPPPEPPGFDNWRVEPDGAAVVSGRAAPGSRVAVLVDGAPVADAEVTASGEFAALFTLPPNEKPSLMTLIMTAPDGSEVGSEEMVALGAITGPDVVAAAPEAASGEEPLADMAGGAPEAAAPPAILLTGEGAVVLHAEKPADPALDVSVAIDTISYSPDGAVRLGGRATSGGMVRIYLDNVLQQSVEVPADGQWLATLVDTPPGIYTLRVDQVDDAGKVTSRFETPFKRETLEALAAVAETADLQPPADDKAKPAAGVTAEAPVADVPVTTPEAASAPTSGAEVAGVLAEPEAGAEVVPEPVAAAEPARTQPVTITVQPGFTLWGIAQESYGDGVMYVQVFEANKDKIRNPDLIYPGQVFSMPAGDGAGDGG